MTGTAFHAGPAADSLLPKLEIENSRGNRVATNKIEGGGPTGTLTSPEFKISRNCISFLIGGGDYERVSRFYFAAQASEVGTGATERGRLIS